ncbi:Deoxyribose-phosphate aldolase [Syntrophomonas zehnderi OL-4]|uniref:Deoxyribose-phosphate aldolase n=1 Tax=Syntrophomonas zehnderi OL-4 TaxID=690567 RepID=A0A0E4GCK9_9FIRM|nr:deoxyribose-phosphate aldolase [Syntrophomonas zehnderi]CFY00691.1 Deoxyribose-phosphate aldolase [Syntrophomonas zehnderi OL-4]
MDIALYMDSTNLKPEATVGEIKDLCLTAAKYKMAAVCVLPYRVGKAREWLEGSGVKLCTVIGFPLGAEGLKVKQYMASAALEKGADELDMVINLGALKDGDLRCVEEEIQALVRLKRQKDFVLKVIVETALLQTPELISLTHLIGASGADFIKTSTGFAYRGASLKDIETIMSCRPPHLKIKASGGIKNLEQARQFIAAGADRLGSSSAAAIVEESLRGGR